MCKHFNQIFLCTVHAKVIGSSMWTLHPNNKLTLFLFLQSLPLLLAQFQAAITYLQVCGFCLFLFGPFSTSKSCLVADLEWGIPILHHASARWCVHPKMLRCTSVSSNAPWVGLTFLPYLWPLDCHFMHCFFLISSCFLSFAPLSWKL